MKRLAILLCVLFSVCVCYSQSEEDYYYDTSEYSDYNNSLIGLKYRLINIQLGSWNPVDSYNPILRTSPYIGLRFGWPMNKKCTWYFDTGFDYIIPYKPKQFRYLEYYETAKVTSLFDFGIWFRFQSKINENFYWNRYIGFGVHLFNTDLKYWAGSSGFDEYGEYYSNDPTLERFRINLPFLNAGMDIRYKFIGLFLEFNLIPYNSSDELKRSLGNAVVTTGLNIRL